MSGSILGIIELILVSGIVFGWGVYELYSLRKYREQDQAEKSRKEQSGQQTQNDSDSRQ